MASDLMVLPLAKETFKGGVTSLQLYLTTCVADKSRRVGATSAEVGIPPTDNLSTALTMARKVIAVADSAHIYGPFLAAVTGGSTGMEQLADDPDLCRQLVQQIRAAAGSVRLAMVRHHINRTVGLFENGTDPTSALVKSVITQAIGNPRVDAKK